MRKSDRRLEICQEHELSAKLSSICGLHAQNPRPDKGDRKLQSVLQVLCDDLYLLYCCCWIFLLQLFDPETRRFSDSSVGFLGKNILPYCVLVISLITSSLQIFFSIFLFFFILLMNTFSSLTISRNIKLFKSLRQLQIRLLSMPLLGSYQLVKLDLVNEYKLLLQKCSFRLANSAQINNKLFLFHIFMYSSVWYMKLISEKSLF